MNRAIYIRMGTLYKVSFLVFLVLCMLIGGIKTYAANTSEPTDHFVSEAEAEGEGSKDTRSDPEIRYIYTTKEIVDNRTFDMPIVINGSGELLIINSATVTILQIADNDLYITVKDNGTLHLRNGGLQSNYAITINLEGTGKIILEENSELKISTLNARGSSKVHLSSSTLTPGIGGLVVNINDNANLELIDSMILGANKVSARDRSTILLKNSDIDSTEFNISCKDFTITSNQNFGEMIIEHSDNFYISGSIVTGLEVNSCTTMDIFSQSKLYNSKMDKIDKLEITNSDIVNVEINEIGSILNIHNSDISGLDIITCSNLKIYDSNIQNFKMRHFSNQIEVYDSVVEVSSFLPKKIMISESVFDCTEKQFTNLTRASTFEALNSSFSLPLQVMGTTEAHLTNCSTNGITPPLVKVYDDALVNIYWWFEVQVLDVDAKPLPEVAVSVYSFWKETKIAEGSSNDEGKVAFKLLGNVIDKNGWRSGENESYFTRGLYEDDHVQNNTGIYMEKNQIAFLQFVIAAEKSKEKEQAIDINTVIGIIIFIIIFILIGLSLTRNSKNNGGGRGSEPRAGRSKDRGSSRSNKDKIGKRSGHSDSSSIKSHLSHDWSESMSGLPPKELK